MRKVPQTEIEKNIILQTNAIAVKNLKKMKKQKIWLSIGKWFADNIVSIGALVVAIIALFRTV